MTPPRNRTVLVLVAALAAVSAFSIGLAADDVGPRAEAQTVTTPSSFVPIDAYRTLDTRLDADLGRIEVSETIVVTADEDTEGVQVIPDEATAVTFNITAVDTVGKGFLQVTTGRRELGNTSTVNWTRDGANVANSGVTALFESENELNQELENTFAIFIDGLDGSSAHVVVDITGYYIPA